jgi:hypothetical protein
MKCPHAEITRYAQQFEYLDEFKVKIKIPQAINQELRWVLLANQFKTKILFKYIFNVAYHHSWAQYR